MDLLVDKGKVIDPKVYVVTKKIKSGGFQSMGICHTLLKAVLKRGYRVPTPIQRRSIPVILSGSDAVIMARTGSGKTAAFLIPLIEKLKCNKPHLSPRAIILSPTRELAMQTFKFSKELCRFSGIQSAVVVGGESFEEQFTKLHSNPDIIIATPGRLLHIMEEMECKLSNLISIVFDEGDRLFEMGFAEQINAIISKLPNNRQTLLFSATLPKQLVEFTKSGFSNPVLIRLDVDNKISPNLKMDFIRVRKHEKLPLLCTLLSSYIKKEQQTLVFVPTKYHVEMYKSLMEQLGINSVYCYSSMDSEERQINVKKFRNKESLVMLVTDIAARGIDLPLLDNVINTNFPGKPKLFVHRVGRVARAGRTGNSVSFVQNDEFCYMLDLFLFLGTTINHATPQSTIEESGLIGGINPSNISSYSTDVDQVYTKLENEAIIKSANNAIERYKKTRPAASKESIKRAKIFTRENSCVHPIFKPSVMELKKMSILKNLKGYVTKNTVFETNCPKLRETTAIMNNKRKIHDTTVDSYRKKRNIDNSKASSTFLAEITKIEQVNTYYNKESKDEMLKSGYFIPYKSKDYNTEKGLHSTEFNKQMNVNTINFINDDVATENNSKRWDKHKKKFVGPKNTVKKVINKEGSRINSTYLSSRYKNWLKTKNKNPGAKNELQKPESILKKREKKTFELNKKPKKKHSSKERKKGRK